MVHPLTENIQLESMTAADFETVAQLGEKIWRSHYASIISNAQIDYMLADRYTPAKLCLYLNAKDRWFELLKVSGSSVGYCSYALTGSPAEMKLEQLYLLPEFQHKGHGKTMLQYIEKQARTNGISTLMLQVNKYNASAIEFYHKAGFVVREQAVFEIGNGFAMDDYVLEKTFT